MEHHVKIISKESLNHDVVRFRLERPNDYSFTAGQAIELTIDEPGKYGPGPFTFTALNTMPYLELMTKIYRERKGLTAALADKKVGDKVIIGDPWDSFQNKGPGAFIAGGAGITPFVALLRQLKADGNAGVSQLLFFNKTSNDIFLQEELTELLGDRYVNILTREQNGNPRQALDEKLLSKHISNTAQPFYVCGPPGFIEKVQLALTGLGAKEETVNVSL